ncbi:uncharacterized protein J5M81_005727 [Pluvialis apricaria]
MPACPRTPPRRRRFRRSLRPGQSPPVALPPQPTPTRVLTRTPPLPPLPACRGAAAHRHGPPWRRRSAHCGGCWRQQDRQWVPPGWAPPAPGSWGGAAAGRRGPQAGPEPSGRGLPEGVEYIPTRKKGKNPMKPVGVAWAIGLPCSIILFLLVKREVDKNRLEQLKIRRKMMEANQGEYESERYKRVERGA